MKNKTSRSIHIDNIKTLWVLQLIESKKVKIYIGNTNDPTLDLKLSDSNLVFYLKFKRGNTSEWNELEYSLPASEYFLPEELAEINNGLPYFLLVKNTGGPGLVFKSVKAVEDMGKQIVSTVFSVLPLAIPLEKKLVHPRELEEMLCETTELPDCFFTNLLPEFKLQLESQRKLQEVTKNIDVGRLSVEIREFMELKEGEKTCGVELPVPGKKIWYFLLFVYLFGFEEKLFISLQGSMNPKSQQIFLPQLFASYINSESGT